MCGYMRDVFGRCYGSSSVVNYNLLADDEAFYQQFYYYFIFSIISSSFLSAA